MGLFSPLPPSLVLIKKELALISEECTLSRLYEAFEKIQEIMTQVEKGIPTMEAQKSKLISIQEKLKELDPLSGKEEVLAPLSLLTSHDGEKRFTIQ